MLSIAVNAIIGIIGFKLRVIILAGIPASGYKTKAAAALKASAMPPCAAKSITTYSMTSISFIRGSSLCIALVPGKYCPIVIFLSNLLSLN
jgi:hypothetical protein